MKCVHSKKIVYYLLSNSLILYIQILTKLLIKYIQIFPKLLIKISHKITSWVALS